MFDITCIETQEIPIESCYYLLQLIIHRVITSFSLWSNKNWSLIFFSFSLLYTITISSSSERYFWKKKNTTIFNIAVNKTSLGGSKRVSISEYRRSPELERVQCPFKVLGALFSFDFLHFRGVIYKKFIWFFE